MKIAAILLAVVVLLAAIALPLMAYEKPPYTVLEKDMKNKMLELRRYGDIPIASAPMAGMGRRNESFGKLFRYISGQNRGERKISMTSPVFMEGSTPGNRAEAPGRMSFMLPAKVAKAGAPGPKDENVSLGKIPGGRFAVIRFHGWKSEKKRSAAVETLRAWVKEKGWKVDGEPIFAIYDPPWTPEFMRRNEVLLRLKRREA